MIENIRSTRNVDKINRMALFVVFFWFGFLKIIGVSPAEELVVKLFNLTLSPFMDIDSFLTVFGAGECALGLIWLFPKLTKIAFYALFMHMICAFLPLILLRAEIWQSFMILTLTGQYIVKNIVLMASSWYLYTSYSALEETERFNETKRELVHA